MSYGECDKGSGGHAGACDDGVDRHSNVMARFHQGEETSYNGGVVYACITCGAQVDQHNLDVHDTWHRDLHKEVAKSLKEDIRLANLRLSERLAGLPALEL